MAALLLLATLGLIELGTAALVTAGLLETTPPLRTQGRFWQGDHPDYGVWHAPAAEWEHASACFRATYRTNSAGARDVERARESSEPRVVVLGDSFLEGWGLADGERLSDRLEARTGREHLNFAMSHFSPYQQLLVYQKLASQYDHEAVIFGVFPSNDLLDLSHDGSAWLADLDPDAVEALAEYRFRPYLIPQNDGAYLHQHVREAPLRRLLRRHSYAFNALLDARRAQQGRIRPAQRPASQRVRSEFYEFDESAVAVLEEVLRRLSRQTLGKKLVVVLIPGQNDLYRHRRVGSDPLSARLRELGRRRGFEVVSLLPALDRESAPWEAYFHSCDFHWNARANDVAAGALVEALSSSVYAPGA